MGRTHEGFTAVQWAAAHRLGYSNLQFTVSRTDLLTYNTNTNTNNMLSTGFPDAVVAMYNFIYNIINCGHGRSSDETRSPKSAKVSCCLFLTPSKSARAKERANGSISLSISLCTYGVWLMVFSIEHWSLTRSLNSNSLNFKIIRFGS